MNKSNKIKKLNNKILRNIYEGSQKNLLSNEDLVQILILIFDLLNIMTISEYAKLIGKTYSGIKKHSKNLIKINQFTFVADNN